MNMRRQALTVIHAIHHPASYVQRAGYSLFSRKSSQAGKPVGVSFQFLRENLFRPTSILDIYNTSVSLGNQSDLKSPVPLCEILATSLKPVRYVIHTSPHYNFADVLSSFEDYLISEVQLKGRANKIDIDKELQRIYEEDGIYFDFLSHKHPPSLQTNPPIVNAAKVSELSQLFEIDKVFLCILSPEDLELEAIRRHILSFAFAALQKVPIHFMLLKDSSTPPIPQKEDRLLHRTHVALYQEGLLQRFKSFRFDSNSRFSVQQLLTLLRDQLPFLQQRHFPSVPETVESEIARVLSASFLSLVVKLLRSPQQSLSLADLESWNLPYLCQLLHLFKEFDTEELLLSEAFARLKAIEASLEPSDQALQILLTLQLTYRCGDFYYQADTGRRNPDLARSYLQAFIEGYDRWSTVTSQTLLLSSPASNKRLQTLRGELEELRRWACHSLSLLLVEEAQTATDPQDRSEKYQFAVSYAQRVVRDPSSASLTVSAQIAAKRHLFSLLLQSQRRTEAIPLLEEMVETMAAESGTLEMTENCEKSLLESRLQLLELYSQQERESKKEKIQSLVSTIVTPSLLTSPALCKVIASHPSHFHCLFLSLLTDREIPLAEVFFQAILRQAAEVSSPLWTSPASRSLMLKALLDFFESSQGDFPTLDISLVNSPALPLFTSQEIIDHCRQRFASLPEILTAKVLLSLASLNYQVGRFDQVIENCLAVSSLSASSPSSETLSRGATEEQQKLQQRQLSLLSTMAAIPLSASLVQTGYRDLALQRGSQYLDFYSKQRDLFTASWYSADFLQQLSVLAIEKERYSEADRLLQAAIEKRRVQLQRIVEETGVTSVAVQTNLASHLLDLANLLQRHLQREQDSQVYYYYRQEARELLQGISPNHPLLATLR